MIYVVLFFLGFSLLLYVLLAGADFGAGIVELFSSTENQTITKKKVYEVIGPVWEANHIWIILLIVILWVGFPNYYNIVVTSLHIPLTLMLLGITLRGVAFVFRHYDAYKDNTQLLYDWMFRISSLVTPVFLGMTFGAIISGKIRLIEKDVPLHFAEVYFYSWFNTFSLLTGFFFAALCAFLASVLLIGEANIADKNIYVKKASKATLVVVTMGFATIAYGYFNQLDFTIGFLNNSYSLGAVLLSAIGLWPLWSSIKNGKRIVSRTLAGLQVILILFAALVAHYPNLLFYSEGSISILEGVAPEKTITVLGISLLVGGAVILPGLFHLLKSFKMIKILEK